MNFVKSLKVFKRYAYLLQQLVARDFKVKYKRSVLGVLWSVLNPLFTMIILNVVFSTLFGMGNGGTYAKEIVDYPVYLLTGIVLFNYFSEATNLSLGAVVGNFNLITKVYMPKYIFPFSKVLSSALNLLFSMVALYMIVIVRVLQHHVGFHWTNVLLPYDLICIVIFAIGMGMLLSALTVFFRDMFYIYGVVLTAWMYLTPIMYPIGMIQNSKLPYAKALLFVMKLNPLYHYVNYARQVVLIGTVPSFATHLICMAFSLLMLGIGILFFRSKQDKFIYYI
ncbi:MAG: ABC transporter permease [Clostridia bacterium]|nr:ABC transporter permease [Clostridia bacterium]MDR3643965.1 ABC transporter permease [Clostridia bacterium]